MKREWRPGEMALVNDCTRPERPWEPATCIAARTPERETTWRLHRSGGEVWGSVSDARPLVAIDPEDREQVERLWRTWATLATEHRLTQDNMQAALREFADPKPPRIDEPGTWGVVEASCVHGDQRREWIKFPSGSWHAARPRPGGGEDIENPDDWDSLIDPALIREGIQP